MSCQSQHQALSRGNAVTVCHPSVERRRELPAALVSIVHIDLSPSKRPNAEQQTHTIKRLVIEACDAEQSGHAFLSASGFWPNATPTAKE